MGVANELIREIFRRAADHEPMVNFLRGRDDCERSPELSISFKASSEDGARRVCFDVTAPTDDEPTGLVWVHFRPGTGWSGWDNWGEVKTVDVLSECFGWLEGKDQPFKPGSAPRQLMVPLEESQT